MDTVLAQISELVADAAYNLGSVRETCGQRRPSAMKLELNNAMDKLARARALVEAIEEFD